MTERFLLLVMTDHAARWRALLWSWAIGTTVGVVAVTANAPMPALAILPIVFSILALACFVARYIAVAELAITQRVTPSRRAIIDYAYAGVTAALFAITERMIGSPRTVHAATSEVFKAVELNRPIPSVQARALQSQTQRMLESLRLSEETRKVLVEDYAKLKAAIVASNIDRRGGSPTNRTKLMFAPKEPSEMFPGACNMSFDHLDIETVSLGSSVVKASPGCRILFFKLTLTGFTQALDNIVWVDVEFERCTLLYSGGSLTLVNVLMKNCVVKAEGGASPNVVEALRHPPGAITVTSEFVS